jgi:hypothetical protein
MTLHVLISTAAVVPYDIDHERGMTFVLLLLAGLLALFGCILLRTCKR